MRKQDGAWFGALAALVAAAYAMFRRRLRFAAALGLGAVGFGVASRRWSRNSRGPFPYSLRWFLAVPHPISPGLLRRGVEPEAGNHILEIGPGTGRHAVQVAQWIGPTGTLDVFDIQQDMLDAVMRRGFDQGLSNIIPSRGQAGDQLPYPDGRFNAAYLVTVFGEIPDPDVALRELRRVLRPGGRLAVGEVLLDPDYASLRELRSLAESSGFRFVRRYGSPFAYVAQFDAV
ncbi:MAG TPA: methyltransferase domain-containing protein [Acidimicrobiia bacterium]|nr:methyltransferase domain-containing protein [Acidimicrobiia bacterium]